MMEPQRKSSGDDDGGERGLLHCWRGYSYSMVPERLLLPRPVLQVALGAQHGVLLVEGETVVLSFSWHFKGRDTLES
ncbi:hypothetical protein XENORESO_014033 [Xenotaenia resolanae]|uniref:Uncharacterized protein n=1 Tax=Xenotaenia resolanae TaxID=208358 RepID=A0ABV0X4A1_9TELE